MFGLGLTEIGIVAVVILLVFGPSRLPQLGKSLGGAISSFRSSLSKKGDTESTKTDELN